VALLKNKTKRMTRFNFWLLVIFVLPFLMSWLINNTSFPVFCHSDEIIREGKVTLITGASSGIGRELAIQYYKKGYSLILIARTQQSLEETSRLCKEQEHRQKQQIIEIVQDVSAPEAPAKIKSVVDKEFNGRLDIAILNHGQYDFYLLSELKDWSQEIEKILNVNTFSSIRLAQTLVPYLEKTSGTLTGIGSGGQFIPIAFMSRYLISKSALQAFFDHLRTELTLLGSKVHVQYIIVGEVSTTTLESLFKHQDFSIVPRITPSEAAREIICVVDRKLSHTFVPFFAYILELTNPYVRPLWPLINQYYWSGGNKELQERIAKNLYTTDNMYL
jgi:3-oxoacyl-[acyl-carrier protein] reductase